MPLTTFNSRGLLCKTVQSFVGRSDKRTELLGMPINNSRDCLELGAPFMDNKMKRNRFFSFYYLKLNLQYFFLFFKIKMLITKPQFLYQLKTSTK